MSAETILTDFSYGHREPRQHSILKETSLVVPPLYPYNQVDRKKEITFDVPESEHFTPLHEAKLKVTCKITKKNGVACNHVGAGADVVAPINNVFHSLFSKVSVYLNNHLAEMGDNYAYKAYLGTLLTYDKAVMDVRGALTVWEKDTATKMDTAAAAGGNSGSIARSAAFANSKVVTMIGRLQSDIAMQGCSIPPNTRIKFVLEQAEDNFLLMTPVDSEYEMHILTAELLVQRQHVPPSLTKAVKSMTAQRNIKLNYRRVEVVTDNIDGTKTEIVKLFPVDSVLPDRILLGFVTNKAYAGQLESNPFNFQHFDYTSIQLVGDGVNYPSEAYTPDFGGKDYLKLYDSLLREFNADNENHMINITPNEFANGYTLIPFRLVPRACSGDVLGESATGSVSLKLVKKTESAEKLTIIALCEYRSEYEITKVGEASNVAQPQP